MVLISPFVIVAAASSVMLWSGRSLGGGRAAIRPVRPKKPGRTTATVNLPPNLRPSAPHAIRKYGSGVESLQCIYVSRQNIHPRHARTRGPAGRGPPARHRPAKSLPQQSTNVRRTHRHHHHGGRNKYDIVARPQHDTSPRPMDNFASVTGRSLTIAFRD